MFSGESSACREFVTAPADRSGGVVARLCTLIPDPARPVSNFLAGYSKFVKLKLRPPCGPIYKPVCRLVHKPAHSDVHDHTESQEGEQHR